jgi:DNA-binding transcriptional LysR family regulator
MVPLEALAKRGGLARSIDVHVGLPPELPRGCLSEPLYGERFVCMVAKTSKRGRMSIKEYTAAAHVRVQVLDTQRDLIDRALAQRGLVRHIALTVPHFSLLPWAVAESAYVATLSRRLAELYAPRFGLSLREPPIDLQERNVQMVWHRRTDHDPGARFFRGAIRQASRVARG